MRMDAAATQPVFGGLCHQVIGIAGHVRNGPILEREAATSGLPQSGGNLSAIDAVARNGQSGVPRMR